MGDFDVVRCHHEKNGFGGKNLSDIQLPDFNLLIYA